MQQNLIYHFSAHHTDGNGQMKDLLGSKGAALAEMSALGINVPAGFTISTELCHYYYNHQQKLPTNFDQLLEQAVWDLEKVTAKQFAGKDPLLVAVRSGSKESMPGMMDTILNLGLNDEAVKQLEVVSNSRYFAYDSYARFIQMYGHVVMGVPNFYFEAPLQERERFELTEAEMVELTKLYQAIILKHTHKTFPQDIKTQLKNAITAVLNSWMSNRAIIYRRLNNIPETLGTAVTIQSMVFGNKGQTSATGVVFSRNPSTGENKLYGEYLINAQGEDVVAGIRTPETISDTNNNAAMAITMPEVYKDLLQNIELLERHYQDMQDIEFTVEEGKLYILQTRSGKRTAAAAIKIAVDLANAGIIDHEEAIMRVEAESLNQLLHAQIDYNIPHEAIATGLPASPGAACGIVVFSPYDAEELAHHHKVILVRNETSPEDIKGMHVASGILTVRGGMTSHAAVVARGMGRPCICGAGSIVVNEQERFLKIGELVIRQGQEITIDGSSGKVFLGQARLIPPTLSAEFEILMGWVDEKRRLKIRANAETVLDAGAAVRLGAEGIGLCRTEHMFFSPEKIALMREMIVAPEASGRHQALAKLLPIHKQDFKDVFRILADLPVNIRLLDPPLHEFLPQGSEEKLALAKELHIPLELVEKRLHALHEVNPMLGHRGCRLGITFPEIYTMQAEAIFTAMLELKEQENITIHLEIMLPLISDAKELAILRELVVCAAKAAKIPPDYPYQIGTMIELPRAALQAAKIAEFADYFSFGTNDLTQTTYGLSRDDGGSFVPAYLTQKIIPNDPFVCLDQEGVGELIKIAVERGRTSKPQLKIGICGEHGGNPESIHFFNALAFDYVSCSPYRIPIARVAAAQAAIQQSRTK